MKRVALYLQDAHPIRDAMEYAAYAEEKGFEAVPVILAAEDPDLMVGLTHMGYEPYGDETDSDLLLAEGVAGIDVIIGGHSHTFLDPAVMVTSVINPEGTLVAQAGRYALTR